MSKPSESDASGKSARDSLLDDPELLAHALLLADSQYVNAVRGYLDMAEKSSIKNWDRTSAAVSKLVGFEVDSTDQRLRAIRAALSRLIREEPAP